MSITTQETPVMRTRVEWATVPRVDLLPPEIHQARALRRTKGLLGVLAGAAVVVGALGIVWSQRGVSAAEAEVEVARARTAQLQSEQAKYAEVPLILAKLEAAETAREQAMGKDVLWYRFLDELAADSPSSVLLQTMKVTIAPSGGTPSDALTPSNVGEVVVTGRAKTYPDVAKWLTAAVNISGMEISRLQTAQLSNEANPKDPVNFTADVRVSDSALSHRYERKAS